MLQYRLGFAMALRRIIISSNNVFRRFQVLEYNRWIKRLIIKFICLCTIINGRNIWKILLIIETESIYYSKKYLIIIKGYLDFVYFYKDLIFKIRDRIMLSKNRLCYGLNKLSEAN